MGGMGTDPVTPPAGYLHRSGYSTDPGTSTDSGYSWATVSETEVDCELTPLTVVVPVMGMV
jgi:hypothetical protein